MVRMNTLWARLTLLIASLCIALSSTASAQEPLSTDSLIGATADGYHRISILLCTPSQADAYTIYGHAAMRVRSLEDLEDDYVYNYGVFDFDQPGFYTKFIKGETDGYFVQQEPWDYFLYRYHAYGQNIYELELDLSPEQEEAIRSYLAWNIKEENKYYLYNFAFDNCATRPYSIVKQTLPKGWRIELPQVAKEESLRSLIDAYADYHPWYRLGTQLALGAPADTIMTVEDRLFLPMEMDRLLQQATIVSPTGTKPLVSNRIVYDTPTPAPQPVAHWWLEPVLWMSLLLVVSGVLCYLRRSRYWTLLWMTGYACAGCILSFLTFVSIHPCTDPNYNLLVFHPLLLLAWFALGRGGKAQRIARYFHSANALAVAVFLILVACAVQTSSLPIILLALNSALLSVAYLTYSKRLTERR